jgi:hypothetical protein
MNATFRQYGPAEPGRPIRGTFYPSAGPSAGGSIASALPKLLAFLVAIAVIRNVVGGARRRHGGSRWSRRREAIAEFHRELHARDAATGPAEEAVKA